MAESDEPDDHRLAGRTPRSVRPGPPDARPVPASGPDDEPTTTTPTIRSTPSRA